MNSRENFIKNLNYSNDSDILDLQKKYEAGIIKEEDLTEEQYNALIKLYDSQINNLQTSINEKKYKLRNYIAKRTKKK